MGELRSGEQKALGKQKVSKKKLNNRHEEEEKEEEKEEQVFPDYYSDQP